MRRRRLDGQGAGGGLSARARDLAAPASALMAFVTLAAGPPGTHVSTLAVTAPNPPTPACLDEGVMVAGADGITVVRQCAPLTLLGGSNVDLAETDGAGGVVFQRSSPTASNGLSSAPIERIARDGHLQALVTPPAGGSVQLQTVSTTNRRTTVVYTLADAAPRSPDAITTFPRSTVAARLGGRAPVALDHGTASVGAESDAVSGVSHARGRYVMTYDDAGSGHLEARADTGRPIVLRHNPYPSDVPGQAAPLAALSPDGTRLATAATAPSDSTQVEVGVLNLATGAEAHVLVPNTLGGPSRLDFDGQRVLLSFFNVDADGLPSSAHPIVVAVGTGARQLLAATGTATFAPGRAPVAAAPPTPDCSPAAIAVSAAPLGSAITAPYTWQRLRCLDGWAAADLVYGPPTQLPSSLYVFRADLGHWTLVTAGSAFASREALGGMPGATCQQLLAGEAVDCSG
jgi:hypothetical protein